MVKNDDANHATYTPDRDCSQWKGDKYSKLDFLSDYVGVARLHQRSIAKILIHWLFVVYDVYKALAIIKTRNMHKIVSD